MSPAPNLRNSSGRLTLPESFGEWMSLVPMPTWRMGVSSFEAWPDAGGILLVWSTTYEMAHAGFNIHRASLRDGDYVRLNKVLLEPGDSYRFLDQYVRPNTIYFYRLEAIDLYGTSEFFGPVTGHIESGATLARRNQLEWVCPNPFGGTAGSAETEIRFELVEPGLVNLRIFDALGRIVRVILDEKLEAGAHRAIWDGRNGRGGLVGSGVYFCRLEAEGGQFSETRPLTRIK